MTIEGALNDLNILLKANDIPIYYKPSIKSVMDTITMEKMPKMGKWLIKNVGDSEHAICSVCGDDSYLSPEWDALELYKYCSNCGAKMQEVEE